MLPPSPRPRLTTEMEQGRRVLGQLLNYWLKTTGLSARKLAAITDWAVGEGKWLDSSIMTRIKLAQQQRGAGLRQLVAMGAVNELLWICDTHGVPAAIKAYGPHSAWNVREEWLVGRLWLPVPKNPADPLVFGDFAEVLVGQLSLPYLAAAALEPAEPDAISNRLSDLLNGVIQDRGLNARDGLRQLLEAYPSQDKARRGRLTELVLGSRRFDMDEIEAELYAISETIRALRDQPIGSYGPGELARELSADRPPSA